MLKVVWADTKSDAVDAMHLRQEIFVEEQKFSTEFDTLDDTAHHLMLYEDGVAIGAARIYTEDPEGKVYHAGRICIKQAYRGQGLGAMLLQEIEREIARLGGTTVVLDAQCRACGFYEKQGYQTFGQEHMDEYCPHIGMKKNIAILSK